MFVRRVRRKLASLARGLVRVRPSFGVFSPACVPGPVGTRLSRPFVPVQIRRAARRLGIRRPLVWVACPPASHFVEALDPVGVVYQRTDRYEAFEGVDPGFIGACNRGLLGRADLTLYCSHLLLDEERDLCRRALFLDHGVDFEAFASAGRGGTPVPPDVAELARPRVGFVGGVDAHTFDPELFLALARSLPEASFFLVGACSLPEGWCTLPNVRLLGQRPYEEVPAYMAAADVLVMPWNRSEWIRACNPVKLKEYLAVGRPVVSRGFHELGWYEGLLSVADEPSEFVAAVRTALGAAGDPEPGRAVVREATWTHRKERLLAELAALGLEPA